MADVEAEEAPAEEAPAEEAPPAEDEEEAEEALEGEVEEEPEDGEEEQELSSSEEDPFELLDESEPDDEDEQAMYKEYLEVIKDIDAQNRVIQDLKSKATELRCKRCKTYKDRQEYKQLRICQEQQDIHLQGLINRAALLQNFGSRRLYGDLEMELTEAEQSCFLTRPPISSLTTCPLSSDEEECCCNKGCCWESDSDSDSEPDDGLCWTKF